MPDEKIKLRIETYEHEEEVEYEEDYSEDEDNVEQQVASGTWDLEEALPLSREAADWYLLYSLWLDDKDEAGLFMRQTSRLKAQFARYADMVVGGELRYTLGHVTEPELTLPEELYDALSNHFGNVSRSEAWEAWYSFRRSHSTNALYWAESAFKAFGGDSHTYGGSKWAYIARTLRMYETGEISPIVFVDMCWGLEHNGGQFFGKLWSTYRLKSVLDLNLNDDFDGLLREASPGVRKIMQEVS